MELQEFLKQYHISENDFKKTGFKWENLIKIQEDYEKILPNLEPTADFIVDTLKKLKDIKYLKSRLKNSTHLIEKIIRKKIEKPKFNITLKNYRKNITDLIGVRAIHLFKDDWFKIHEYIIKNWDLNEKPIAYIRDGDQKNIFKDKGLNIREHPKAYRSIHYIVKCNPSKELNFVEVQVRTIFEEAWSEIDHLIRYPYDLKNEILSHYLILFNRLAGHADEMGTYIKYLSNSLKEKEQKHKFEIENLKNKINKLEIAKEKRDALNKDLDIIELTSGSSLFDKSNYDNLIKTTFDENKYPGRLYTGNSSMVIDTSKLGEIKFDDEVNNLLKGNDVLTFTYHNNKKNKND